MRRHPLLLLLAGIAVLLVCSRVLSNCSGSPSETGADAPPEQPPPAGAPAGPPRSAPAAPPGTSPGAGAPPGSPHAPVAPPGDDHPPAEVTGEERLDPARVPAAVAAAERFAEVWSTPDPDWHDNVAALATPALAESLVEPPPRPIAGTGSVLFDAPEWARVQIPTDRGTLVLDVVLVEGRWLVSALDWRAGDPP